MRTREHRAALVAQELSHPAHRALVGDAGEHELRAVVVDDGLRRLAVDRVQLREVLPDGDKLHADAGGGRGELREAGDGGDVPGLVEQDQQRRVKRLVRACVAVIGGRDHLAHERRKERREALLLVGRRAHVDRAAALDQARAGDPLADRGRKHLRVAVGGEHALDARVDRGDRLLVARDRGLPGFACERVAAFSKAALDL